MTLGRRWLSSLEKNRWIAGGLLAALFTLIIVAAGDLGRYSSELPSLSGGLPARANTIPVARISQLISSGPVEIAGPATKTANPFYTTFYEPPPPRTAPRKITVTYLGLYQTASGEKQAFLKIGDKVVVAQQEAKVAGDITVGVIGLKSVTLKSAAGTSHEIGFNRTESLEVPGP